VERQRFLDHLANRLGRPRLSAAPPREVVGVSRAYAARPLGDAVDRVAKFRQELERVGVQCALASSLADAHALVRAELARWKAKRIVAWAASEMAAWDMGRILDESSAVPAPLSFDPEARRRFRETCLSADLGITSVDVAVANTGTLVVSARVGRPRSVSLLPTVHLALVRESQLVDRLGIAIERLRAAERWPSAVHCITGPSRTSDIENDLSIGVHGPAAVSIVLWRDGAAREAAS
jgi:L-lactate dehydrogenase complex protein LldG